MCQHRQQGSLSRTFETNVEHVVEKYNEFIERTDFPNTHSFNCSVYRCYGPLPPRRPTVPHKRALKPILVLRHLLHYAASRKRNCSHRKCQNVSSNRAGKRPVSQKHHVQLTAASELGLFTLTEIASQTSKPPSEQRHREGQTVYRWASSTCLNQ